MNLIVQPDKFFRYHNARLSLPEPISGLTGILAIVVASAIEPAPKLHPANRVGKPGRLSIGLPACRAGRRPALIVEAGTGLP
ncbi:hypothetical protein AA13594_0696 [Gluconacetobacter azotocaptans DSM 13594]|nr:hypothetical protein AA13594_0696 [Gluconacetobacter azotocaptans DSM 13594]